MSEWQGNHTNAEVPVSNGPLPPPGTVVDREHPEVGVKVNTNEPGDYVAAPPVEPTLEEKAMSVLEEVKAERGQVQVSAGMGVEVLDPADGTTLIPVAKNETDETLPLFGDDGKLNPELTSYPLPEFIAEYEATHPTKEEDGQLFSESVICTTPTVEHTFTPEEIKDLAVELLLETNAAWDEEIAAENNKGAADRGKIAALRWGKERMVELAVLVANIPLSETRPNPYFVEALEVEETASPV